MSMINSPWSSMTDRERDAALAEALGCNLSWDAIIGRDPVPTCHCTDFAHDSGVGLYGVFDYTCNIRAMRIVENEIERQGKAKDYMRALVSLVSHNPWIVRGEWWDIHSADLYVLFHAKTAQRAEAAYKILAKDPY